MDIENKENSAENDKNVFKMPMTQVKRVRNSVNNGSINRIPSISKPLIRASSVRMNNKKKNAEDDIVDLTEKFSSKTSFYNVAQDYFNNCNAGKKAPKASNLTMASLGNKRITPEQAAKLFGQLDPPFCADKIAERIENIKRDTFPRIMVHLKAGYNVLLFGFGSKLKILNYFHKTYLSTENSIVIPGFSADVSIQTILTEITSTYMANVKLSSRSVQGMAESVRDYFTGQSADILYIVVHNIDGHSLRNSGNIFSVLAQSKGIRIVATVDHIHSGMMWTENKIEYLWHDCTTMEPYSAETRIDNARLMSSKSGTAMASLLAVLDSLNDQAKTVFMHLAKYQLAHRDPAYEGMLLDTLYGICKDNLLVNSELALRTHLIEFKDHRLVTIKQGLSRSDYIKIEMESASVKEFLDKFYGDD